MIHAHSPGYSVRDNRSLQLLKLDSRGILNPKGQLIHSNSAIKGLSVINGEASEGILLFLAEKGMLFKSTDTGLAQELHTVLDD